jgi:hypothetical protein
LLIRQIEADVLEAMKSGLKDPKELSETLSMEYNSLHCVLRRMVTHNIISRVGTGKYEPAVESYSLASDEAVQHARKYNPDRPIRFEDPLANLTGKELEEVKVFVQQHCKLDVPRRTLIERLKKRGYDLTKSQLLQFIQIHDLAPKRKERREVVEIEEIKEFIKLQYESNVPSNKLIARLKKHGYNLSQTDLALFIEYHELVSENEQPVEVKELQAV